MLADNSPDFDNVPLADAGSEKVVPDNPKFIAECKSQAGYDMSRWVIYKSVLTLTEKWGLVWRLDYSDPSYRIGFINTLVCWKQVTGEWVILRYLERKTTT